VIREAPATWESSVGKAKPLVEYLIGHHAARFDLKQSIGRIGFVEAVIPAIRDIADPLRRDEALQEVRRVSGVEERVLRQVLERRLAAVGPGRRDGESRITAGAVLASPDALPVGDILRAVTPVEAELLRLLLLVPDEQVKVADQLGPDQLPSTLARELYRAIVLQRAADDQGIHPPFDGAALLLAVDDETASLARALYAKAGPDPRNLEPRQLAYEIARLLLELEDDQLRARSEYNEAAQAEAERDGDAASIERLLLERRQINESRRSLDRRREETRLLARPEAAVRV
jgi:DNA primase